MRVKRLVKRTIERAKLARNVRERKLMEEAFQKGLFYGATYERLRIHNSTQHLTYEETPNETTTQILEKLDRPIPLSADLGPVIPSELPSREWSEC